MESLEYTQKLYKIALAAGLSEELAKLYAATGINLQTIRIIER